MIFSRIDISTGEINYGEMPFSSLQEKIKDEEYFFIPNNLTPPK